MKLNGISILKITEEEFPVDRLIYSFPKIILQQIILHRAVPIAHNGFGSMKISSHRSSFAHSSSFQLKGSPPKSVRLTSCIRKMK